MLLPDPDVVGLEVCGKAGRCRGKMLFGGFHKLTIIYFSVYNGVSLSRETTSDLQEGRPKSWKHPRVDAKGPKGHR